MLRTTHTTVSLAVSEPTFREIERKLREAGYDHCFDQGRIDMSGIALEVEPSLFGTDPEPDKSQDDGA